MVYEPRHMFCWWWERQYKRRLFVNRAVPHWVVTQFLFWRGRGIAFPSSDPLRGCSALRRLQFVGGTVWSLGRASLSESEHKTRRSDVEVTLGGVYRWTTMNEGTYGRSWSLRGEYLSNNESFPQVKFFSPIFFRNSPHSDSVINSHHSSLSKQTCSLKAAFSWQ